METKPTVLVVDDVPDNLLLANELLKTRYRVKLANSGKAALRVIEQAPLPDLILLDVMMPDLDGYAVCASLKNNQLTADIPVIFLTANGKAEDEMRGFQQGAVDHIAKPFVPERLLARVDAHIRIHQTYITLKEQNQKLETLLNQCQETKPLTREAASAPELVTDSSAGQRAQGYARVLIGRLQHHPKFAPFLSKYEETRQLEEARALQQASEQKSKQESKQDSEQNPQQKNVSPFAMIGEHLLKEEFNKQSLSQAADHPFFKKVIDGPADAANNLMAVACAYDSLVTERTYTLSFDHDQAIRMICDKKGQWFDPDVVDAMLEVEQQFSSLAVSH